MPGAAQVRVAQTDPYSGGRQAWHEGPRLRGDEKEIV